MEISQPAKDFGYEEPKTPYQPIMPDKDPKVDLPQAIITAASALGQDNIEVQRVLHENKLQLEQVNTDEGTFLQVNDVSEGDSIPLYHIQANQPLTQVETAALDFDRLGDKQMSETLMREAAKATDWKDTIL